jgi:hypothetical protein
VETYLSLCALLARRSGVIGAAPSSVLNQTGKQANCVDWVSDAWRRIQQIHPSDWTFLQGEWEGSLTQGNSTYSAVTLGIATRFGSWKGDRPSDRGLYRPVTYYDPLLGAEREAALSQISFAAWRDRYDRGDQTPGPPLYYAIAPDQTLRFGPAPDMTYTVRGEYLKAPQILAANEDVPDLPEQFHQIIVDRAIMIISEYDEAPAALAGAIRSFNETLSAMNRTLLPCVITPGER